VRRGWWDIRRRAAQGRSSAVRSTPSAGPVVYVSGGLLVFVATYLLRNAFAEPTLGTTPTAKLTERASSKRLGAMPWVICRIGIVSAFVTRLAYDVVPTILTSRLGSGDTTPALLSAATLGGTTLFAPPLQRSARKPARQPQQGGDRRRVHINRALSTSFVIAAAIAIVLGAAPALHLDCALQFILESLPPDRAELSRRA
jgi:hypothetical protein